jgi:two-component system response regulator HydG
LRERQEDVSLIAHHFLEEFNRKHHANITGISDEAEALLKQYSWPGNVRELRNVIERAVVLAKDEWIREISLPAYIRSSGPFGKKLVFAVGTTTVAEAERELIVRTLEQAGNNKAEAARQLGVDVKTIYNKLKAYNIEP